MHGLPLESALRQVVIAQGGEHSINDSGAAKGHKPGKVMPSSKQSRTCLVQALLHHPVIVESCARMQSLACGCKHVEEAN